jgi:hypothetical protein
MSLTTTERQSIGNKQIEFTILLQKSVQLTYLMLNINNTKQIKQSLFVFNNYTSETASLVEKYGVNYSRLKDYDQIAYEIFQVFLIKLLLNMLLKFSSRDQLKRQDSYNSAKMLAHIANEYLDHNKPHYK